MEFSSNYMEDFKEQYSKTQENQVSAKIDSQAQNCTSRFRNKIFIKFGKFKYDYLDGRKTVFIGWT